MKCDTSKLNFAGKICHAFISNRPISILVFLAIVFLGVGSYIATPKQYNPDINLPAFQISVEYKGATAQEVEKFITSELEEKIADIEGVDKIHSISIDGGMSIVNVEFEVGEDLEGAKVKIQSKLSENMDLRKEQIGMGAPLVKNVNPENVPILTFGFFSETLSQNEVRIKVIDIMDEVKKIPDVANLDVHGGEKRALRILLNPRKMKLRKVSADEVRNAILASNIKIPAGVIRSDDYFEEIEVNGTFLNKEAAEKILVLPGVKLADVAEIVDGYSEKSSFVEVSKNKEIKDAVFLSIAKRKGSNSVVVAEMIKEKVEEELQREKYGEIDYELFRNEGEVAKKSVNNLFKNLTTSIAIVSIVLFIFLGFRPALIVAIAIPLTLALTFFFGYLFGETINRISLFALILSLGLLIDSATVVIENIYRHIQKGENKRNSIIAAVNEVGVGLLLSTLTSVIVFLPTARISGMMGEYMRPLSIFVPLALVMSLLVAYKITPFLADVILSSKKIKNQNSKTGFFDKLSGKYAEILSKMLASKKRQIRFLIVIFTLLIVALSFPIFEIVHFRMLPAANKDQFYIYVEAPEGTNFTKTKKIAHDIIKNIEDNNEIVSIQNFTGEPPIVDFNGLYKGASLRIAPNMATLRVNLTEHTKREIESEEIVKNIRKQIYDDLTLELYMQEGVRIRLIEDPPGPPVAATLQSKVKGPNVEIREKVANDLLNKFNTTAGVVDSYTSIEKAFPRITYSVNQEKAFASGVTTAQVASSLHSALGPVRISQFHIPKHNEIAYIEMQFKREDKNSITDLSQIYIKNQLGKMIPIDAIVKKIETRNEPMRLKDARESVTFVNAEMSQRSVVYAVVDLIKELRSYEFPNGGELISWNLFGFVFQDKDGDEYKIEWGGEWKMTLENFIDLGTAMLLAFLLIYAVLVAQFKSFGAPALIMSTIPLGFLGILPGFALLDLINGTFLTATSLIGFVALMGIVVNNAILYLEYFDQLRAEGMEVEAALVESGRTRMRPIILTSLTTILGTLTIASDPVWSGLAWAIIFGLSLSSLLTLVVFPILYNLVRPSR